MVLSSPFPYLRFTVGPIRHRREDGVLFEVGVSTLVLQFAHYVWLQGRGGWCGHDGERFLGLDGSAGLDGSLYCLCAGVFRGWRLYEPQGLTEDALFAWLHPALGDLRELALSLRVMES